MRVFLLSLLVVFAVTGLCLESSLMTQAELRSRVLMTSITDFAKSPILVHTPDFALTSSAEGPPFIVTGHDKRGERWQVFLKDAARGAWQSHVQDQRTYFSGYTSAAGTGPSTWILALSFSESGQPVPFFVTTHGSYDDRGIEDVLDRDGNGPEPFEQSYWRNVLDGSGYYATTRYQQRGSYWYCSDGRHGTHVFPAFEKWSAMWKDRPVGLVDNPPEERPVHNPSNDPAIGIQTRIISGEERNVIRVSPEVGCENVTVGVIVTQARTGRRGDLQPSTAELGTLAKAHAAVVLTGLYRWPGSKEAVKNAMPLSCGQPRVASSGSAITDLAPTFSRPFSAT